jgi:RNA polymerase sigma-70 factor (ECF subfamily)
MIDNNQRSLRQRAKRAFDRASRGPDTAAAEAAPDPAEIARLEYAVRRMPRLQREIFLAVRLDDYSYGEIAERTGLSVAKVGRLFAKSLATLMRNLDHPGDAGGGVGLTGRCSPRPALAGRGWRFVVAPLGRP